jgi:hypothetical protein
MKPFAIAILPVALAACTSTLTQDYSPPPFLHELHGRSASDAIALLGEPTRRKGPRVATTYVWKTEPSVSSHLFCKISVAADAAGRIASWTTEGSREHCETFARRLKAASSRMSDA